MDLPSAPTFAATSFLTASLIAFCFAFGTDVQSRMPTEPARIRRPRVWVDCMAWSAFLCGLIAVCIGLFVAPETSYLLHGALLGLLGGAWAAMTHAPPASHRVVLRGSTGLCRGCGYPTEGVRIGLCPECGLQYGPVSRSVSSTNLRVATIASGVVMLVLAAVVLYFCAVWKPRA